MLGELLAGTVWSPCSAHWPQGCAPFWLLLTGPCLGCSTSGPYRFLVASRTKPRLPPVACTRPPPPSSVSTQGHGCTLSRSRSAKTLQDALPTLQSQLLCGPCTLSSVAPTAEPGASSGSQCVSWRPSRLVLAGGGAGASGPVQVGLSVALPAGRGTAVLRSLWMAASSWHLCGGDAWGLSQGASWRRSWCLPGGLAVMMEGL